ncbi:MAG: ATP-binding protein, partial [Nitrospirota bacterium]
FRIVQEALNNVAKHAGAKTVRINVSESDGLVVLAVCDDGAGFNPEALRSYQEQPRWGILSMQERAQAIGGKLTVDSAPGNGTSVVVRIGR